MTYSVAIVTHPDFGQALGPLADRVHVWLVGTPANRAVAEAYWRAHPGHSLESGVTTFVIDPNESAEATVERVLSDVDLHHGEYSHAPPWDTLEVYGAAPITSLREALAEFGVTSLQSVPGGFHCTRAPEGAV